MASKGKVNLKANFIEVFKKNLGIIDVSCTKVGIARKTYYNWRNSDKEFADACDEAVESTIDFVEAKLLENINANDVPSVIFFLKTKGKKRGYTEKIEIESHDLFSFEDVSDAELDKLVKKIKIVDG